MFPVGCIYFSMRWKILTSRSTFGLKFSNSFRRKYNRQETHTVIIFYIYLSATRISMPYHLWYILRIFLEQKWYTTDIFRTFIFFFCGYTSRFMTHATSLQQLTHLHICYSEQFKGQTFLLYWIQYIILTEFYWKDDIEHDQFSLKMLNLQNTRVV